MDKRKGIPRKKEDTEVTSEKEAAVAMDKEAGSEGSIIPITPQTKKAEGSSKGA